MKAAGITFYGGTANSDSAVPPFSMPIQRCNPFRLYSETLLLILPGV